MEELAVHLKYSGQGFAHDAIAQARRAKQIALWVLVKCDRCFTQVTLILLCPVP